MDVSPGGFYKWLKRPSGHNESNVALLKAIKRLFVLHDGNYGYPRICRALCDEGWQVNRKRVARLMREERLVGKAAKIYRRKKLPENRCVSVDNLRYKKPAPTRTNQQWAGDVSYLSIKGSWIYLSVVLDLYSRKVIGWSLGTQRTTALTLASLEMALSQRDVKESLIFHTDKGSEYASHAFQTALKAARIRPSMNRPKSMVDNIHVESFFRTFKTESYHGEYFLIVEPSLLNVCDGTWMIITIISVFIVRLASKRHIVMKQCWHNMKRDRRLLLRGSLLTLDAACAAPLPQALALQHRCTE